MYSRCFNCGKQIKKKNNKSREHIPPKTVMKFKGECFDDLITFVSCKDCNTSRSLDDSKMGFLLNELAICEGAKGKPIKKFKKIIDDLNRRRPHNEKTINEILSYHYRSLYVSTATIPQMSVKPNMELIGRNIEIYFKAFYSYFFKPYIFDDYCKKIVVIDTKSMVEIAADIENVKDSEERKVNFYTSIKIFKELLKKPKDYCSLYNGDLKVMYDGDKDGSVWFMLFYNVLGFFCVMSV